MLDTLLLVPSLHRNTSLHFTTLNQTTLHYTYRHFTSSHLHFTTLPFGLTHYISYPSISPHITKLDTVRFSHPQMYFQSNEPLHCPKEPLNISLHFTFYFYFFFIYPINSSLHFTLLFTSTTQSPYLHFLLFIAFTSPLFYTFLTLVFKKNEFYHGKSLSPLQVAGSSQ